jgi:hypothetical protein
LLNLWLETSRIVTFLYAAVIILFCCLVFFFVRRYLQMKRRIHYEMQDV